MGFGGGGGGGNGGEGGEPLLQVMAEILQVNQIICHPILSPIVHSWPLGRYDETIPICAHFCPCHYHTITHLSTWKFLSKV